jgi:hypothetical protein
MSSPNLVSQFAALLAKNARVSAMYRRLALAGALAGADGDGTGVSGDGMRP